MVSPAIGAVAKALIAGQDAAKQRMETALKSSDLAPVVNGWRLTFHMFDYNLDHLGPGTIDDPAWKIPDRHASYLRRGADGSLTIVIQHEPPPDTSNWLPAPAAPFRPLMRLYQPQPAILDGTYKIPPITKAAS